MDETITTKGDTCKRVEGRGVGLGFEAEPDDVATWMRIKKVARGDRIYGDHTFEAESLREG